MSTLSWVNIFNNNLYKEIHSPLTQFEIRNLLSIDAPILFDMHISITNIGIYLIIGGLFILALNFLSTNNNKLVSNNWLISQETLYATIHSMVINQINPKNGQVYFPFIYALFVFILINNLIGMVQRCLYYTIFPNMTLNHDQKVNYSSSYNNYGNFLHPYFITGFIDGEGCFNLSIFKDSRRTTGWQVKPRFLISLHKRDRALLELIKTSLGVGTITERSDGHIKYSVGSLKDLKVIIDHLDKYPLITQKLADFILFKQAYVLIENKEHLTEEGLLKIVSIKASLNLGLSEKLREAFPNIISANRPIIESVGIKDQNWLTGFVEAEGCFLVVIQEFEKTTAISLRFTLTQHSRDKALLESFVNYLGCGRCYRVSDRNEVCFITSSLSDTIEKIIPLLNKYPLVGAKRQYYLDFVKVSELMKSKDHLTKEGLKKIKLIKSGMNSRRYL